MLPSAKFDGMTNEALLAAYKESGDGAMKQELVIRYSYLVKAVAMQMRGAYISFAEIDDIVNEGIIALMGAIEKFDPSRNVKLETYASLRIKGTIVDIARKQDWTPRNVRKKAKDIDKATMELYEQNGKMPSNQEVADYMGMTMDKYYKAIGETNLYNVVSLDSMVTDFQDSFNAMPVSGCVDPEESPSEALQKKEMKDVLKNAITSLSKREQLIISLYYRKELSMKEIARVLEVSEPRISQLHSTAIKKLRLSMESYL
ncbi:MAG: FliA/WhiG family RNA polymerase sigma factor [Clostridia bacterium]|nr:FliA/WhiG family RNA polymerase sigma factor [Clostridia bacterium]